MDVFSDLFGFDPYVAIATVINFLLVVGILWWFVFRPLSKSLKHRQAEIAESLDNAEKLKIQLKEAEVESGNIIAKANQQASAIIEEYTDKARQEAAQIKEQAEQDILKAQTEAKEKLEQTKHDLEEELKSQTADLALAAAKKLVMNKLDVEADQKLIEEYLDEIEKQEK